MTYRNIILAICLVVLSIEITPVCCQSNGMAIIAVRTTAVDSLGHVGAGFQNDDGTWTFGGVEGDPDKAILWGAVVPPIFGNNGGWVEEHKTLQEVEVMFHALGYDGLKVIQVSNYDPNFAYSVINGFPMRGYNVVDNNCLSATIEVLAAYGVDNLPSQIAHVAPNDYYANIEGEEYIWDSSKKTFINLITSMPFVEPEETPRSTDTQPQGTLSEQQGTSIAGMSSQLRTTQEPLILNTTEVVYDYSDRPDTIYQVKSVTFSPDGNKLAAVAGNVTIWDVGSGTKIQTMEGYKGEILGNVVFSSDGTKLATGASGGGDIIFWDTNSGVKLQWIHSFGPHLAFSSDGSKLITLDWHGIISIWDATRGTKLQTMNTFDDTNLVDISRDGSMVATTNSNERTTRIWDVASLSMVREIKHDHPVTYLAFVDSNRLATLCDGESEISIWDVNSGEKLQKMNLDEDSGSPMAISPDGNKLATYKDWHIGGSTDGIIRIWDVTSGTKLQELKYDYYLEGKESVAFSPDSTKLAAGYDDGYTLIWTLTDATSEAARVSEAATQVEQESQEIGATVQKTEEAAKKVEEKLPTKAPGFEVAFAVLGLFGGALKVLKRRT